MNTLFSASINAGKNHAVKSVDLGPSAASLFVGAADIRLPGILFISDSGQSHKNQNGELQIDIAGGSGAAKFHRVAAGLSACGILTIELRLRSPQPRTTGASLSST